MQCELYSVMNVLSAVLIIIMCAHESFLQGQKQSGFPPGPGRDPNKKKQDVSSVYTCMYMYLSHFNEVSG